MKLTPATAILTIGLLAVSLLPVAAAEPDADQILRQMSAKLGGARSFTFKATRQVDPALLAGRNEPANANIMAAVQRPNKVAAHSTSKEGVRRVYADGRNMSLVDAQKNLYATVPMPKTIDGLVAEVDRKYGFTLPLAEFVLSDIYQDIHRKAQNVTYLGQSNGGGGACHRLGLSGTLVDTELWVGVSDQLPRKLIATVKELPGKPQVKVDFSDWNLAAKLSDKEFVFVPPQGARKIPMITIAETAVAQKKQ